MTETQEFLKSLRETVAFNLAAIDREIADLPPSPSAAESLTAKGMALYYAGLHEQAKPLLSAALAIAPSERTLLKLAKIEARTGAYESAIRVAGKVAATNQKSVEAHEIIASSLLALGRNQEATIEADKGLALAPDSQRCHAVKAAAAASGLDASTIRKLGSLAPAVIQIGSREPGMQLASADHGQMIMGHESMRWSG